MTSPTERLAVVGADNKAISNSAGGPTVGANWYLTPHPAVNLTSGRPPAGPGDVVVDADTAAKKHLVLGSPLRVVTGTDAGTFQVTVSGIATFRTTNPGETLFYFDTGHRPDQAAGQGRRRSPAWTWTPSPAPRTTRSRPRCRRSSAPATT